MVAKALKGRSPRAGFRGQCCILLALAFTAAVSSAPSAAEETVVRLAHQTIKAVATLALPGAAELVHDVVQVDLGAPGKCIVALYRADRIATNYSGVVLLPADHDRSYKVTRLPPMREANGLFDIEVSSIFAAQLRGGDTALVILYRYARLGSGQGPNPAGYAYIRRADKWVIDEALSRLLLGVTNARQARARLGSARD